MKAFLSHSSRDKTLVREVAELIGGANAELDELTFDQGLINVSAIHESLKRSSIFVLFLSKDAIASNIVRFEALQAQELLARGVIEKFLVICLDPEVFVLADAQWKNYNFVRKAISAQSIARLIQHQLTIARAKAANASQPFVGRVDELRVVKDTLGDPKRTDTKGLFISGNLGIGRRTFARRVFQDVHPAVNTNFPEIQVEDIDGLEEIYWRLNAIVTPISTASALRARAMALQTADDENKARLVGQLLGYLLEAREAVFVNDQGGLLKDVGDLNDHIKKIVANTASYPHPSLIFIAERMIPKRFREALSEIVFASLPSFSREEMKQLFRLLLKAAKVRYSEEDMETLIELSDAHPFNAQLMVEDIREHSLEIFLADPSDFHYWKRGRGSAFLAKISFSNEERLMLAALKDFKGLDMKTLVEISKTSIQIVGSNLRRLLDLHVIESTADTYQISPPLRVAVERDPRFSLTSVERKEILRTVSNALSIQGEDDEITVSMIDAGILATLQDGGQLSNLFSAFLLPSHFVWLARRTYHTENYDDCLRYAKLALDGINRLSPFGQVEAGRYLCLAAARLDKQTEFQVGLSSLRRYSTNDAYARSNINFLVGFNYRLMGNLPEAEAHLNKAYAESPGNFSAVRELASICLVRGNLEDAEKYARHAYSIAADNPYILDILLSVLVKLPNANRGAQEQEIEMLFEKLKQVGDEGGKSFYATRKAEYEYKYGSITEARRLIDDAVSKTPGIFRLHAMRAEIYLEAGDPRVAKDEITRMKNIVYRSAGTERLTNLRPLLELEAKYYLAIGDFEAAKKLYDNKDVFTEEEAATQKKKFDQEQAFRRKRDGL